MNCILCHLSPQVAAPVAATHTVFGMSVCTLDAERLTGAMIDGYSVRDVLREAKTGDW